MGKYVLLLFVLLFVGCRSKMYINGEKKYIINSECGKIELKSRWAVSAGIRVVFKPVNNDVLVHTDSLFYVDASTGSAIETRFYYGKEQISGDVLIKKGKVLRCYSSIFTEEGKRIMNDHKTFIPPNKSMICNDKLIMTDTLFISPP